MTPANVGRSGAPGASGSASVHANDFVQSLDRGLAVIHAFPDASSGLTAGDVAGATGLTRAAARRFLLTLADLGYVRVDGRLFRLSPRVLELGRAYLSGLALPEVALPHLREFVTDVRESSSLAVLDGDDIIYVGHVGASRILSVVVTVGGRDPGWATSLGRVLLAAQSDEWLDAYFSRLQPRPFTSRTLVDLDGLRGELVRVRRQGWSLVDQEFEEGLRALAAPIRDADGQVIAAVNVSLHASRWGVGAIRGELLPRLLQLTATIEHDVAAAGISLEALPAAIQPQTPVVV